jgi:hypothetical protein
MEDTVSLTRAAEMLGISCADIFQRMASDTLPDGGAVFRQFQVNRQHQIRIPIADISAYLDTLNNP